MIVIFILLQVLPVFAVCCNSMIPTNDKVTNMILVILSMRLYYSSAYLVITLLKLICVAELSENRCKRCA